MSDPVDPTSWYEHKEKALEYADDWRKRAMFQTALANGAGLLALGSLVQNNQNHDATAHALVLSAVLFSVGLIVGSIAPFLMISRWEQRAKLSHLNKSLLQASRDRLRIAHLTNDSTEVDRLVGEGEQGHGYMRALAARASICIGISGILFCAGMGLTLLSIQLGALRSPPLPTADEKPISAHVPPVRLSSGMCENSIAHGPSCPKTPPNLASGRIPTRLNTHP